MQAVRKVALGKRSRYYHGQIDMELLLSGRPYDELPNTYVIFVCDFDPFGQRKYRYIFNKMCQETIDAKLEDGSTTIFLSTRGKNNDEVSPELVKFLEFVKEDLAGCEADFEDEFIEQLQKSVQHIKASREMEGRYMVFEEVIREERQEAKVEERIEAILELLQEIGTVSGDLHEKIKEETNLAVLRKWHKLASQSESIEQFTRQIDK